MTAAVEITLDTHPPIVAVEAAARVPAGAPWKVRLTTNKDVSVQSLSFIDALADAFPIGSVLGVGREVVVWVPTIALAGGAGRLSARVVDQAGNVAEVAVPVEIERTQAFSAVLLIDQAFDAEVQIDGAFEGVLLMDGDDE